jgi:hypothetical protein
VTVYIYIYYIIECTLLLAIRHAEGVDFRDGTLEALDQTHSIGLATIPTTAHFRTLKDNPTIAHYF